MASVIHALTLTGHLWWRHWPQLVLLVLVGYLANHFLLEAALQIGIANHVLGLCSLAIVVLAKLVVIILMFHVLKPSLPVISTLGASLQHAGERNRLVQLLALSLAPFFAYYAAWGFLSETVRDYSLKYLDLGPFGIQGDLLDALHAPGLIAVVAAAWVLRKLALLRDARKHSPLWKILITLCEAIWLFIGLFVINKWKDQLITWWHSRVAWHAWLDATTVISLRLPEAWGTFLKATANLFFYSLLPLVWLAMTALIYGREVRQADELLASNARFAGIAERYKGLPAVLHRTSEHFVKGYRTRFLPVVNCVRLTLTAGLPLLVLLCVGYRALNWASLWAWIGLTEIIGPHSFPAWQTIGNAMGLLLVDPIQNSASVFVEPLRICLLAAVLETALSADSREAAEDAEYSVSGSAA